MPTATAPTAFVQWFIALSLSPGTNDSSGQGVMMIGELPEELERLRERAKDEFINSNEEIARSRPSTLQWQVGAMLQEDAVQKEFAR